MSKKQEKNKVMSKTKGAKNKPKKEVIKMKAKDIEFKTIDEIIAEDNAKVSVKIELKVTKDDIKNIFGEAPQTPPLPNMAMPVVQTARVNVNPNTNLTRTQEALLSPEEKIIASRRI